MSSHSNDPGRGAFARALQHLSTKDREILRLRVAENLQEEEIAFCLNLPRAVVERRLAKALERLDRALERTKRPWWMFW